VSDATAEDDAGAEPNPFDRALDLLVFAPVGMAVTVADDLEGLIAKGRQRVETEISNARLVGKIVVTQGQRELSQRLGDLFGRHDDADAAGDDKAASEAAAPAPSPKPAPDPVAEAIVARTLADYETLSASQVVRRLESLGPDELRAVHRHEASHRNRRTILNRASQLLGETAAPDPAG
jgi:hypothetical protein